MNRSVNAKRQPPNASDPRRPGFVEPSPDRIIGSVAGQHSRRRAEH